MRRKKKLMRSFKLHRGKYSPVKSSNLTRMKKKRYGGNWRDDKIRPLDELLRKEAPEILRSSRYRAPRCRSLGEIKRGGGGWR